MDSIILHPTEIAQWQALVNDAKRTMSYNLSEDLESYLVFLLMRFSKNPDIFKSIIATEFLLSLKQLGHERDQTLRDVGDKCLLFSGFFPGRAKKCRVRISYFVKLGQTAYDFLANMETIENSKLFSELCQHFVILMEVLQTMQELKKDHPLLDLIEANELWMDTKSHHALKILREHTNGFILQDPNFHSTKHH